MVAECINNDEPSSEIHEMLNKVPAELGDVYLHVIKKVIDDRQKLKILHLLQWVYFAMRPLSVAELRYAIALDDASIDRCGECLFDPTSFAKNEDIMQDRIRSISGGLVEVKPQSQGEDRLGNKRKSSTTVQFIHQSVKDFLTENGVQYLTGVVGKSLDDNIFGQGHDYLLRTCVNYLKTVELQNDRAGSLLRWSSEWKGTDEVEEIYPLLFYAADLIPFHAQNAEEHGVLQHDLTVQFEHPQNTFQIWTRAYGRPGGGRKEFFMSSLLQLSSYSNLSSTLRLLLKSGISTEERNPQKMTALHFAACKGHCDIVEILLDAGAKINSTSHMGSPVVVAASRGQLKTVKLLIKRGADIHTSNGHTGNALYQASRYGQLLLVRMLIDYGADVNAQGGYHGNALQAASLRGH
jgi:hypothetical protein